MGSGQTQQLICKKRFLNFGSVFVWQQVANRCTNFWEALPPCAAAHPLSVYLTSCQAVHCRAPSRILCIMREHHFEQLHASKMSESFHRASMLMISGVGAGEGGGGCGGSVAGRRECAALLLPRPRGRCRAGAHRVQHTGLGAAAAGAPLSTSMAFAVCGSEFSSQ